MQSFLAGLAWIFLFDLLLCRFLICYVFTTGDLCLSEGRSKNPSYVMFLYFRRCHWLISVWLNIFLICKLWRRNLGIRFFLIWLELDKFDYHYKRWRRILFVKKAYFFLKNTFCVSVKVYFIKDCFTVSCCFSYFTCASYTEV